MEFRKDCPGEICETDLKSDLSAKYDDTNGYFVIGTSSLQPRISITKTGDPSYGSVFCLAYPDYIKYSNVKTIEGDDVTCTFSDVNVTSSSTSTQDEASNTDVSELQDVCDPSLLDIRNEATILVCSFGNPLRNDTGVVVDVYMSVPTTVTKESFQLSLLATTQSKELNADDNMAKLTVQMRYHVTLSLDG